MCRVRVRVSNAIQVRENRMSGMPTPKHAVGRERSRRCNVRAGADENMTKCMLPTCNKEGTIKVTTPDGKTHSYCSMEHMNDHRNILIHELMRK